MKLYCLILLGLVSWTFANSDEEVTRSPLVQPRKLRDSDAEPAPDQPTRSPWIQPRRSITRELQPADGSPTINLGACFKSSAAVNVVAESQYAFRGAAKGSKYKYCSQTFRIPAGLIAAVRCDSVSRDLEITYESQTILSWSQGASTVYEEFPAADASAVLKVNLVLKSSASCVFFTLIPTTSAPPATTAAPTTDAPTTAAPITAAPTTAAPTTQPACTCGLQSLSETNRIVGGTEAPVGDYPWAVRLTYSSGSLLCGGSLVSANWVVTAAHCLDGKSTGEVRVELGRHSANDGAGTYQVRAAQELIVHEGYNARTIDNDVALIRINPVTFTDEIIPICLPFANSTDNFAGALATTVGWGRTSEGGSISDVLMEVDVPVLTNADCSSLYGRGQITDQMVCAGYVEGEKDACNGDSGGPLFVKLPEMENRLLVGITSWGYGCARRNYPGVYARVTSLTEWIERKMQNTQLCRPEGYTG